MQMFLYVSEFICGQFHMFYVYKFICVCICIHIWIYMYTHMHLCSIFKIDLSIFSSFYLYFSIFFKI